MISNIKPYNQNPPLKNQVSFGSIPLVRANVIKHMANGTQKYIPVNFSAFEVSDWESLMENFFEFQNTKYGPSIFEELFTMAIDKVGETQRAYKKLCFMVEDVQESDPLTLMLCTHGSDGVTLRFLQAASTILQSKAGEKISGAAQTAMYGLVKYVKSLGLPSFMIKSTNHSFYENIFQLEEPLKHTDVYINCRKFLPFLRRTQYKYKFDDAFVFNSETMEKIRDSAV